MPIIGTLLGALLGTPATTTTDVTTTFGPTTGADFVLDVYDKPNEAEPSIFPEITLKVWIPGSGRSFIAWYSTQALLFRPGTAATVDGIFPSPAPIATDDFLGVINYTQFSTQFNGSKAQIVCRGLPAGVYFKLYVHRV